LYKSLKNDTAGENRSKVQKSLLKYDCIISMIIIVSLGKQTRSKV